MARKIRSLLPLVTATRVREVLSYTPETGLFVWKKKLSPRGPVGTVAGCLCPSYGYWLIGLDGRLYRGHHLAWLFMTGEWPSQEIDHKDTVRNNNSWENLRLATRVQNEANKPANKKNKSGLKGVSRIKSTGKWAAFIKEGGKSRNLGTFATPEDAHNAYIHAAKECFGEFARWE